MSNLQSPDQRISRRDLFKLAGAAAAGLLLPRCAIPPTEVPTDVPTDVSTKVPTRVPTATPTPYVPPDFSPPEPIYEATTYAKSQEQVSATATAMAPKTAEIILKENEAPSEVMDRSVLIKIFDGKTAHRLSGMILESMMIGRENFALVLTAGHVFSGEKPNEDITINQTVIDQPQFAGKGLKFSPPSAYTVFDYTQIDDKNDQYFDCGLLLIKVSSDLNLKRLTPATVPLTNYQGKLFGLGYPASVPNPEVVLETIPYIVNPDERIVDSHNRIAEISPSSSPGGSGTVLLNEESQLVGIIYGIPVDAQHARCSIIPPDFSERRDRVIAKLHHVINSLP